MKTALLYLSLGLVCFAQVRPAPAPESPSTNLPAHKIGPNDLLGVSVYDAPELTRMVRVSDDGFIRLPMLKDRIEVLEKLPLDVENSIGAALEANEILVRPVVTVNVAEYASRPVNVSGAVKQPQTFQAIGPLRLLDALSKAGGLTDMAGSEILVTRADEEARHISVKGLLESADPSLNVVLRGGEDIRVAEAGKAFVIGNVKKPGAFVLKNGGESSLLEILAQAEGLASYASGRAWIYRRGADGSRKEMPVELSQILKRKQSDIPVMADDILYIPESKGRMLTLGALDKAVTFGTSAGTSVLIWGLR